MGLCSELPKEVVGIDKRWEIETSIFAGETLKPGLLILLDFVKANR